MPTFSHHIKLRALFQAGYMNFNVNREVLEKNPGITLDAAMILIDQKKMAVLYSNEVENFSSQDSNMTGETINT